MFSCRDLTGDPIGRRHTLGPWTGARRTVFPRARSFFPRARSLGRVPVPCSEPRASARAGSPAWTGVGCPSNRDTQTALAPARFRRLAAALALSALLSLSACERSGSTAQGERSSSPAASSGNHPEPAAPRADAGSDKPADRSARPAPAVSAAALELKRKRQAETDWPRAASDAPNILIVTIDTLRAGHLGCYGYFRPTSPNIDAFSKECILFEECYSPVAQTLPTHTSLFTSVYPRQHGITANMAFTDGVYVPSPYLYTIATVLSQCGYTTAAFVSAEPVKKEGGLNAGFQTWDEPEVKKVTAPHTVDKVLAWLNDHPREPFFLWVHLFDPHAPYEAPKPYGTMFQTDDALEAYIAQRHIRKNTSKPRRPDLANKVKVWNSRVSINGYDGEIAYTDAQLVRVFDTLRDLNLWDAMSIVVTSDHGEGLGQHAYPEHNEIWQEQVHVPLMMRVPGQSPRRVATRMSTVDILPTLLGILGNVPGADRYLEQSAGTNVLAEGFTPHALYAHHPRSRPGIYANSIIVDGWKYIYYDHEHGPSYRTETDKLYNLNEDPFELHDLSARQPDRAATLKKALLDKIAAQTAWAGTVGAGKIKPVTGSARKAMQKRKKGLQGLGYMDEDDEEEP